MTLDNPPNFSEPHTPYCEKRLGTPLQEQLLSVSSVYWALSWVWSIWWQAGQSDAFSLSLKEPDDKQGEWDMGYKEIKQGRMEGKPSLGR